MRTLRGSPGAFGRARNLMALSVVIAVVAAIVFRQPDRVAPALWTVAVVMAAVAGAVALVMRILAASAVGDRARTYTVVAWAVALGAALFGLAIYFMGAPLFVPAPGLLVFLVAITLVPVPRR